MEMKKIGRRGVSFTDQDTSVYLICGEHRLYLCDTHWGPNSMDAVKEYIINQQLQDRELIIFNTHSDYDHVWGNSAFGEVTIIGHEACRQRMEERGQYDLEVLPAESKQGQVELRLPNLTFTSKLEFADDEVEFIYAPGHTIGSAICYDRQESVVFVGDLLEAPMPMLLHHDLETFIDSLEYIKGLEADLIVTTHSGIVAEELIETNITYLQAVLQGKPVELDDEIQQIDDFNRKNVLFLKYEQKVREKLGDAFDYPTFMKTIWHQLGVSEERLGKHFANLVEISNADLQAAFDSYLSDL